MKHIGEPVRNFYRKQGWEEGYKAGNGILVGAVESAKAAERERIANLIRKSWWSECECVTDGLPNCHEDANVQAILDLIEQRKTEQQVTDENFRAGVLYALDSLLEVYGDGIMETDVWQEYKVAEDE